MEPVRFTVPSGAHPRLVAALLAARPGLRPGQALSALRRRDVRVNGAKVQQDRQLAAGDMVEAFLPPSPPPPLVYRDERVVIADKPPGLPVCDSRSGEATLRQWLEGALGQPVYPLHRLDHHTSGLVAFALTPQAQADLLPAFQDGRAHKRYRCLVKGCPPPEGDCRAYLLKEAKYATVRIYAQPHGAAKPIHTRFWVLEHRGDMSLLEVELLTGRTHQIRAHLAFLGYPVAGDDKYGDRAFNRAHRLARQQLRAVSLRFEGLPEPYGALNRSFSAPAEGLLAATEEGS